MTGASFQLNAPAPAFTDRDDRGSANRLPPLQGAAAAERRSLMP